jgi:hypothetical protein
MDTRLALMCGTDYPVPECQIIIHQPRIKEIALIGESDFFSGIQCLCLNKSMFVKDESLLANTNNFQIFMTIMSEKEAANKKFAVQQVCTLLFPKYKVMFTPRSVLFSGDGNTFVIDETNFEFLQAALTNICCLKTGPMDQQSFNPGDAKAREIAEKLMRGRQRVAAQKGETNISIFSQYLSMLTVGLGSMSLQDAMDLTMFQLYDLVERYMLYINWDMDVRCRLAGGKPESQPDNWMKNIH